MASGGGNIARLASGRGENGPMGDASAAGVGRGRREVHIVLNEGGGSAKPDPKYGKVERQVNSSESC